MTFKKIYLDIDLTLADTATYALKWHDHPDYYQDSKNHGIYSTHDLAGMGWREFWSELPTDFWASVPKLPWADFLIQASIDAVGEENVYLLTSPIDTPNCYYGKHLWVLSNMPNFIRRLIITPAKEACVGADGLLIDDAEHNQHSFDAAGKSGNFWLMPSLSNRKSDLALNLYKYPEIISDVVKVLTAGAV